MELTGLQSTPSARVWSSLELYDAPLESILLRVDALPFPVPPTKELFSPPEEGLQESALCSRWDVGALGAEGVNILQTRSAAEPTAWRLGDPTVDTADRSDLTYPSTQQESRFAIFRFFFLTVGDMRAFNETSLSSLSLVLSELGAKPLSEQLVLPSSRSLSSSLLHELALELFSSPFLLEPLCLLCFILWKKLIKIKKTKQNVDVRLTFDFETTLLPVVRSSLMRRQSQFFLADKGTCWSETPFPAPVTGC